MYFFLTFFCTAKNEPRSLNMLVSLPALSYPLPRIHHAFLLPRGVGWWIVTVSLTTITKETNFWEWNWVNGGGKVYPKYEYLETWTEYKGEKEPSTSIHLSLHSDSRWNVTSCLPLLRPQLEHVCHCAFTILMNCTHKRWDKIKLSLSCFDHQGSERSNKLSGSS